MNDHIQNLIELLRSGNYDDPSEKIGLLAAALRENGGAESDVIVMLLKAEQVPLRLAALDAAKDRDESNILEAVRDLVKDTDLRIRQKIV